MKTYFYMPFTAFSLGSALSLLLVFSFLFPQPLFANDSSHKKVFESHFSLLTVSNNLVTLKKRRFNRSMTVKLGESFTAPKDRHSKIFYIITSIDKHSIVVKYQSIFSADSFGGPNTDNKGTFVITTSRR